MTRQWYRMDLHVHTCLSPCADDDMTPQNIVQMAALERIQMLAITDHNSAGNSLDTASVAEDSGIVGLYGMEVETREGVHVLVYFANSFSLLLFEEYLHKHLPMRSHRPDVWGRQLVVGVDGNVNDYPWLLSQAAQLSLHDVMRRVQALGGILIPAHAERRSFGLFSVLGAIPAGLTPAAVEMLEPSPADTAPVPIIVNSDAHTLAAMVRPRHRYTYLWGNEPSFDELCLGLAGHGGRKVVVGLDEGTGTAFAGFGGKFRKGGS